MISISSCRKCNLFQNQLPLTDKQTSADVMWVGLSAKRVSDVSSEIPLAANTNTGKIISAVEQGLNGIKFYKTNLVKCLPLNSESKLRYPDDAEMKACYRNLLFEIRTLEPKVIFLLGEKVASFVLNDDGMNFSKISLSNHVTAYRLSNSHFIPIAHPSFIYIYRRKKIKKYINSNREVIDELIDVESKRNRKISRRNYTLPALGWQAPSCCNI